MFNAKVYIKINVENTITLLKFYFITLFNKLNFILNIKFIK